MALELKNSLYNKKEELQSKLISSKENLSANERIIYSQWLQFTQDIIAICVNRNKF